MYKEEEKQRYHDLVYIYKKDIYRIIFCIVEDHYVADELSHIVMINAWKGFSKLRNPARSKAWVKAIARNVIRQYMNDKSLYLNDYDRDFINEVEEIGELKLIERDILEALLEKENIKAVIKSINALDYKYRIVVKANLIGHISLKEIADTHGMNPGTVRMIYSRGIKKVKENFIKLEKGEDLNG